MTTFTAKAGLVSDEQIAELEEHAEDIDIERASQIEAEIHHDLMAEIRTYAEQCPKAGAIIHLGATSMDILDNMDAIRLKEALGIIIAGTEDLLEAYIDRMEQTKGLACMAFTHLQPAEVTTVGYRLAQSAQDLVDDLERLRQTLASIKGKGMKGAVGTGASYKELVKGRGMSSMELERLVMDELGLECFDAATQIYTRIWASSRLSAVCAAPSTRPQPTSASSSRLPSESGPSPSARSRSAPPPCPSSAIRSTARRSTR